MHAQVLHQRFTSIAVWALFVAVWSNSADADVIRLQQGGELRGQLIESPNPDSSTSLTIQTLAGTMVTVPTDQVAFVAKRSLLVEEYVGRCRTIPHTIEAHWALADWCRIHKLDDERAEQIELLLDLDPDHADSRKILGYVQERGQWMTREDQMASRGYVKHKGRWITQQELSLLQKNAEQRKAELEWYPKVRMWLSWLTGPDARKQNLAIEELGKVDSPDAVPALVNFLGKDEREELRQLFLSVAGRIGTSVVVSPILDRYLYDSSAAVRDKAFSVLPKDQYMAALPILVAALKHELNPVVNRAGKALGIIGDVDTVPALIDALVTSHRYRVAVPSSGGISIGYTPNGQAGMVDPRMLSNSLPPEVAGLARTGQLPYGATVTPAFPETVAPKYVTVRADVQNADVLGALEKMTGKSLGFNERDWQLWWALNKG